MNDRPTKEVRRRPEFGRLCAAACDTARRSLMKRASRPWSLLSEAEALR